MLCCRDRSSALTLLIHQWQLRHLVKTTVADWWKEWKAVALGFPTEPGGEDFEIGAASLKLYQALIS